jgi:hypothetical protein
MLREISVAKKAALLKIVDSGTVTPELRQRAVKIAAVEDEMYDLKKTNADLTMALADLDLKSKSAALFSQRKHQEHVENLEAELAEKSKSWAQQADMERRELQRQQELTSAQTAASKLVGAVTELRTRLEASEDSKRKLQKAKIRNQHTMTMLEKQMSLLTAQLGGANHEAVAAASAAVTASLSVGDELGYDEHQAGPDQDQDDRRNYSRADQEGTGDRGQRIESARAWSEKVLEKRHANHVTSLQRQLQRGKEQHRQTTDMLRRAMNRIRKMEVRQEELRKESSAKTVHNDEISSEWTNSKEASLVQAKLEAQKKSEDLTLTRAQLGAIKEEHARLLEYLRARGITAPGGDISSSSAMRYMSGFSSQKFVGGVGQQMTSSASIASSVGPANNGDTDEQPHHRRSFQFSVAPAGMGTTAPPGKGGYQSSMWGSAQRPSSARNKSGFVPQALRSTDLIQPPRGAASGGSAEGWRNRISSGNGGRSRQQQQQQQQQQQHARPQSAPGRRRGGTPPPTSQRETTLKMIETMIGSVKKREEVARAKARMGVRMHTVRPELDQQHTHGAGQKMAAGPRKPAEGKGNKKMKKKRRRKRPQSAAGARPSRTRLAMAHSEKFNRTSTSPRLGISSEHHTRK